MDPKAAAKTIDKAESRSRLTVQDAKILEHGLVGQAGLRRETTTFAGSKHLEAASSAWARGLRGQRCIWRGIDKFVYDNATGGFYFTRSHSRKAIDFNFKEADSYRKPFTFDAQSFDVLSLTLSSSRVLMSTAMSSHVSDVTLTHLPDPSRFESCFRASTTGQNVADHPSIFQCPQRFLMTYSTAWAVAARPHPTTSEFIVAAGEKVARIHHREGWDWGVTPERTSRNGSDALAVDWLDANVAICGHRDGKVVLWDTRSTGIHAQSTPIQHASSISHVRKLGSSKIVVAGLEDQLATYDLRFSSTNHNHNNSFLPSSPILVPKSKKSSSSCSPTPTPMTRPYLTIPTYRNKALPGYILGFDVCPELNLIATAVDRPAGPTSTWKRIPPDRNQNLPNEWYIPKDEAVQIFDASTGTQLAIGESGKGIEMKDRAKNGNLVTCLKFVDRDIRGGEGIRLMVGSDDGIEEWCW